MYKTYFFTILLIFSCFGFLQSQTPIINEGLIAYYSFDNCDAFDDTESGSDGVIVGTPGCVCGVSGNALELDGLNDHILFLGVVNNFFNTEPFSISFYFKSFGSPLTQDILSKREDCGPDNALSISYRPSLGTVSAELSEDFEKGSETIGTLNFDNCWHHVAIVRRAGTTTLFLDGEKISEGTAVSRVDLTNNAVLSLADSPCIGTGINRFKGYIDEITIYNRELLDSEVSQLYLAPDRMVNNDTLLYLGQTVDINISNTCVTNFSWTPTDGVDDPTSENPTLSPTETTTYQVEMIDENGCRATDSIRITVIDPSTLDCEQVFVPKAFTPNGTGPIVNETLGISNPYALDDLISFEIFDRWGGRVFQTDDPFVLWDGTMGGKKLNPGVFLYKIKFKCDGSEKVKFGSVTLIR